jgi:hypothetical protein
VFKDCRKKPLASRVGVAENSVYRLHLSVYVCTVYI